MFGIPIIFFCVGNKQNYFSPLIYVLRKGWKAFFPVCLFIYPAPREAARNESCWRIQLRWGLYNLVSTVLDGCWYFNTSLHFYGVREYVVCFWWKRSFFDPLDFYIVSKRYDLEKKWSISERIYFSFICNVFVDPKKRNWISNLKFLLKCDVGDFFSSRLTVDRQCCTVTRSERKCLKWFTYLLSGNTSPDEISTNFSDI